MSHFSLFAILILLFLTSTSASVFSHDKAQSLQSEAEPMCQALVGTAGTAINLTSFIGADWSTPKGGDRTYTYYANICGVVKESTCASMYPNLEVAQVDSNNTGQCYAITNKNTNGTNHNNFDCFDGTTRQMWQYINNDPTQGISCNTTGSSVCNNTGRTTVFNFVCGQDNNVTRQFMGKEPMECTYHFTFTTCQVCSNVKACTNDIELPAPTPTPAPTIRRSKRNNIN